MHFSLRLVLARSGCIVNGGAASDVIIYRKQQGLRALLSPRGSVAFNAALLIPPERIAEMQALRADPAKPPLELIRALRSNGVRVSYACGLALPPFDTCVGGEAHVIHAWWRMHVAGIEAMERGAGKEQIDTWKRTCGEYTEHVVAVMESREGAGAGEEAREEVRDEAAPP